VLYRCCDTAWSENIPGYTQNWSRKQEYVKSTLRFRIARKISRCRYRSYEFPNGWSRSARIASGSAELAANTGKRYRKLKTRYGEELQRDNNCGRKVEVALKGKKLKCKKFEKRASKN